MARKRKHPSPTPSDQPQPASVNLPSASFRRAWTAILLLHIVAVLLAVVSNLRPVSPLRAKLGDSPLSVYTKVLNLNTTYSFYLTDNNQADYDHFIELEIDSDVLSEKDGQPTIFRLPQKDMWLGARRERMQLLAREVSEFATEEGTDPTEAAKFPAVILRGLLKQNSIEEGTHRFRCRWQLIVMPEDVNVNDPAISDPNHEERFETLYDATVFFDGDKVDLLKSPDDSEVAKVRDVTKNDTPK